MCKFAKISQKRLNEYWNARMTHDAINKAIRKAKSLGFTEVNCQKLIIEKLKATQEFNLKTQDLLNSAINSNLIKFTDDWYGIISYNGKKSELLVYPLNPNSLETIYVDFSNDKAKNRDEYSQFIEDNMNHEVLNDYKNKIIRKQDEILHDFFDCTCTITKNKHTYNLTSHCIKRWNERINNNFNKVTNDIRNEIVNQLSASFLHAHFIYKDSKGSNYYLNKKQMIFYVLSDDNIILTLWKNDFGFTDNRINDISTLMQLEYIQKLKKKVEKLQIKSDGVIEKLRFEKDEIMSNYTDIEKQITELELQKAELIEKRNTLVEKITKEKTEMGKNYTKLKYEESFIFKNHKMVIEEEET